MERRTFLKSLALSVPALYFQPSLVLSASNVTAILRNLDIPLSTAGRFSFYVDYSERSTLGDHTFYICRTHGTSGRVTVSYATYGDSHNNASGSFTWEDGEADIKSFTANVPSKTNGDHHIYALLSNPAGGAVLHNGAKTIAYGVIDDGTIAADSNAVFFNADAGSNGNGTQASPYNNIYDAISNAGNKRYIYGRGTVIPNGTNSVNPNGGGGIADCIFLPTGRTSEANRLYIQKWPGSSLTVTGGSATNKIGFYSDGPGGIVGDSSYITLKGISFLSLNCSGQRYCEGGGIGYFKNSCSAVNVEYCTFDNINGSTNTSGFNSYFVDGGKIWGNTVSNIQVNGNNRNGNSGGITVYYSATNLSFQRNKITNCGVGIYPKRSGAGYILPVMRFNIIDNCTKGILFGYGSASYETSYSIIQSNLIRNCVTYQGIHFAGSSSTGGKNWICNNVFDNCGGGDNGAIYSKDAYEHQIFNNIFYNCRKTWDMPEKVQNQSNTSKKQIQFADYNHEYGTTSVRYEYLSITYQSSAALYAATGLGGNDSSGYPRFTNPSKDNYTLKTASPCLGSGVSGVDKGIYLTGIEKLGPAGIAVNTSASKISKPAPFTAT